MLDGRAGSCHAEIGVGYKGIKGEVSVHAPFSPNRLKRPVVTKKDKKNALSASQANEQAGKQSNQQWTGELQYKGRRRTAASTAASYCHSPESKPKILQT